MAHINVSEFRQNLAAHLDAVEESRAPLFVTRGKGKAVVVLSEDEYESMAETIHLLGNPATAGRLRASIAETAETGGDEHPLIEPLKNAG